MPTPDDLDEAVLARELVRPDSLWRTVQVVGETGSTNADLADRARAGEAPGAVLLTDHQVAGRGRQGRTWTAPPGTGIAVSVLVRPPVSPERWTWLPLLAGLAVSEGIRLAADLPAVLKWPNDVLVLDRKIAGILAERVETPDGPAAVLGMGVNVSLTADQLPVPTATSIALAAGELGAPQALTTRTELATTVLVHLEGVLRRWYADDTAAGLAVAYAERCVTLGRTVRVLLPRGSTVEGVAEQVDPDGRLVVRTATGPQVFGAGDVVHLR